MPSCHLTQCFWSLSCRFLSIFFIDLYSCYMPHPRQVPWYDYSKYILRRDHEVPYTVFSNHLLHLSPHVPITSLQPCFQTSSPSFFSTLCHKPSHLHTQWPQTSIGCLHSSMIISKRRETKRSCPNEGATHIFTPDCEISRKSMCQPTFDTDISRIEARRGIDGSKVLHFMSSSAAVIYMTF
jgi:hypothetical protein